MDASLHVFTTGSIQNALGDKHTILLPFPIRLSLPRVLKNVPAVQILVLNKQDYNLSLVFRSCYVFIYDHIFNATILHHLFLLLHFICVFSCVWAITICHSTHMNVRGQLLGVRSPFSFCGVQKLNSGCQAWVPSALVA